MQLQIQCPQAQAQAQEWPVPEGTSPCTARTGSFL